MWEWENIGKNFFSTWRGAPAPAAGATELKTQVVNEVLHMVWYLSMPCWVQQEFCCSLRLILGYVLGACEGQEGEDCVGLLLASPHRLSNPSQNTFSHCSGIAMCRG